MMKDSRDLSAAMAQTIEYGNLEVVGEIGEVVLDSALDDGILKDIPIFGTIVGVGKCVKNISDVLFVKKLRAFLFTIKDVDPRKRFEAMEKWEKDDNYRGRVGETLLGMVDRCDDTIKATWLSKLFYELVLKRNSSRLFMRAEKTLSSLSVMDIQAFLNFPRNYYTYIRESECEPFLGSGLYHSPEIGEIENGSLDLDKKYCKPTEIGYWIYNILNDISVPETKEVPLF